MSISAKRVFLSLAVILSFGFEHVLKYIITNIYVISWFPNLMTFKIGPKYELWLQNEHYSPNCLLETTDLIEISQQKK